MRTTLTLLMLIAIGCGGAGESSRDQTTTPETTSMPSDSPTTAPDPAAATAPADATAPAESTVAAAPATPASPPTAVAKAELRLVSGDKPLGTMTFERKDNTVAISGQFSGLKKGQNALYIHSKGDCSDKGKNVGAHLNPTKAKHGPPSSPMRHAGDFGDLTFDKAGNASFSMTTDSVTLEPGGADSVVGRAVVVYSRKDNKKGSAGSPVACGVVVLDGASTDTRSSSAATASPAASK